MRSTGRNCKLETWSIYCRHGHSVGTAMARLQLGHLPHWSHNCFRRYAGHRLGPQSSWTRHLSWQNNWVSSFLGNELPLLIFSSTRYELYWFRSGTFTRNGDGGYLNVCIPHFYGTLHGANISLNSGPMKVWLLEPKMMDRLFTSPHHD